MPPSHKTLSRKSPILSYNGIHLVPGPATLHLVARPARDRSNLLYRIAAVAAALLLVVTTL